MISADDLIDLIRTYNPNTNCNLIIQAYTFGQQMHYGQYRHSGEPYFMHPVAVAEILAGQYLDDATIITALLHDTIEDTRAKYSDVEGLFGNEIASLVDGVTKLTNFELVSTATKQAENFRKLIMATSKDIRVTLVKLADRLHNMRTIRAMKPEKQIIKSRETMEIYAPLAGRLGMQWMREELEDLAFQVLNSEARQSIMRRFVKLQKETGDVVAQIKNDLASEMGTAAIDAEIQGRAKKPYSIWRKMQSKDLAFSRLSDIYGFRVIVEKNEDCYRTLGMIHTRWRAVPGRFKDYISQPKSNGYRSLHTTVSGPNARRVEVQIRTRSMHEVAEIGAAATWSYRDGTQAQNPFAIDPSDWITSLTERFSGEGDHSEFLEAVKLEMYTDQVFCFTPTGDVIKLPRGATPIDFAYAIHTRIGSSCVSAKVDGLRVPLWTRLRNGQSVQIITAEAQKPQATWIDIAATGRAKAAIRRSLRERDRERYIKLGRELARVAFDAVGRKATDKALDTAAKHYGLEGADDILARLGSAEISSRDVVGQIYPKLKAKSHMEIAHNDAVVGLSEGQQYQTAQCCQPLPGERIVGITFKGQGVVIHTLDCPSLEKYEDETDRWLDVRWQTGQHASDHTAKILMTIRNGAGVIGRVCTIIGELR
ncbi:MAG: bifunctional (p)ppGpp synthetase/guanosine-3',5'-bis(diphosphate) 3'-pyrophosphohydrolase, partial [Pseudomonadota bacterium]